MATTENSGLMTYKDKSGNTYLMYPVTKAELVDGLDEAIVGKVGTTAPKSHAASHATGGNDPITPADIGAAASSHTHTKSQITDFPSSLKNPSALTIQANGTTVATYDGSSAKTVNITPENIGLGSISNTPDSEKSVKYATTAETASKTANALTIQINGVTQATFNGSAAKSVDITPSRIGALDKATYDADGDGKVDNARNGMWLYSATLAVDGWSAADSGYTQTVDVAAADGGSAVTVNTQFGGPMCLPTGVQETDKTLQETLSIINAGITTPGDGNVTVKVWEQPGSDITVYWYGRE